MRGQLAQVVRLEAVAQGAAVEAGEVEQVGDHAAEPLGAAQGEAEQAFLLGGHRSRNAVEEEAEGLLDGGQRRLEVVRDVGDEIPLRPVQLLQAGSPWR